MPRRGTRQTKLGDKPRFLYDTGGLHLELSPSGSKLWRLKYHFGGKKYRTLAVVAQEWIESHRNSTPGQLLDILRAVVARGAVAKRAVCQPGKLRTMRRQDINFSARAWRYTVPKTGQPHIG